MRRLRSRKKVLLALMGVLALGLLTAETTAHLPSAGAASARIEIWHGHQQKVGHLGTAQPEFNLMGRVGEPAKLLSLQYALNDSIPVELNSGAIDVWPWMVLSTRPFRLRHCVRGRIRLRSRVASSTACARARS
jgi:hypothetical protein